LIIGRAAYPPKLLGKQRANTAGQFRIVDEQLAHHRVDVDQLG
jgi:hypothetical protein